MLLCERGTTGRGKLAATIANVLLLSCEASQHPRPGPTVSSGTSKPIHQDHPRTEDEGDEGGEASKANNLDTLRKSL